MPTAWSVSWLLLYKRVKTRWVFHSYTLMLVTVYRWQSSFLTLTVSIGVVSLSLLWTTEIPVCAHVCMHETTCVCLCNIFFCANAVDWTTRWGMCECDSLPPRSECSHSARQPASELWLWTIIPLTWPLHCYHEPRHCWLLTKQS